ncbi:MAG: antitoxin YezG family protein [Treponema sp.]|jgi:hypothetical protein|nr:antitoxin YezG family protein [Treponema sp.]
MEAKLHEMYGKIANHLNAMVPVEWDKIYLLGEVEKEQLSWSASFYCVESKSGEIKRGMELMKEHGVQDYHKLINNLSRMILALNNCFKEEGQELWEQVSFTLENSGKFDAQYFYDVMHENDGGQLPREVVWAHKTFGFNPPEGNFLRELLDKYKDKTR